MPREVAREEWSKRNSYYKIDWLRGVNESDDPKEIARIDAEEVALKLSRQEERKAKWLDTMTDGAVRRPEVLPQDVFVLPEDEVKTAIRNRQDDLQHQCRALHAHLNIWEAKCEVPPPYTAWRIAIILSKAKFAKREHAFLSEYDRLFSEFPSGKRSEQLKSRLAKKAAKLASL